MSGLTGSVVLAFRGEMQVRPKSVCSPRQLLGLDRRRIATDQDTIALGEGRLDLLGKVLRVMIGLLRENAQPVAFLSGTTDLGGVLDSGSILSSC